MKNKIFIISISFIFIASISSAQTEKIRGVENSAEHLRSAMISGDSVILAALVSDQLSYGHSGGHIDSKKEFVEKLCSGQSDFVTINISEKTISISGKTAIVRHVLNAITNDGGKPGEVHLKVLQVWQKQGRKWKLLARQAVKIT